MFSFTAVFVVINIFFLSVGALLYIYAARYGIKVEKTDYLYPTIALKYLGYTGHGVYAGLNGRYLCHHRFGPNCLNHFLLCRFFGFNKNKDVNSKKMVKTRHYVHIAFSGLMLLTIIIFNAINNDAVVSAIFKVASYTYGPLLGLYSFGLFVSKQAGS